MSSNLPHVVMCELVFLETDGFPQFFYTYIFTLFLLVTYAVGKPDPSLVGYWPFEEKTGKKADDASGNRNDGKLIDGPKWVEGQFGSALEFGDGSYVEVADDPSLDLTNVAP